MKNIIVENVSLKKRSLLNCHALIFDICGNFFFNGWMANMNRALVISQSEEESPFAKLRMVSND